MNKHALIGPGQDRGGCLSPIGRKGLACERISPSLGLPPLMNYGLSPELADRLIAMGPDACEYFERAVAAFMVLAASQPRVVVSKNAGFYLAD